MRVMLLPLGREHVVLSQNARFWGWCLCTGTPLGDPIEVGALGQALSGRHAAAAEAAARQPVALASVKACFGHTEGAAGLTGALLALQALNAAAAPAVMHLRTPNAYVEAALGDWGRQHALHAHVPRQLAPGQQCPLGSALAGSSSFGMSGVNAHMLLGRGAQLAPVCALLPANLCVVCLYAFNGHSARHCA
jgi:acyl transferase domain-containing protein